MLRDKMPFPVRRLHDRTSWFLRRRILRQSLDEIVLSKEHQRSGYSFKGFEQTKSIFVHIPKAAGVSINQKLYGNLGGGHRTIQVYRSIFGKEEISNYFVFTFVRHPVDRLYSAFRFLNSGGFTEDDKKWADANLSKFNSFDEFVLDWLSEDTVWEWIHFKPQWWFVCDPYPAVAVDFVGRFERIEQDFEFVAQRIGRRNHTLIHENKTQLRGSYSTDIAPGTIRRIEKLYEKDFELFGYDM